MANKNPTMTEALTNNKIGTYTESTGGGTPLAKGEKLKDHPEAKRVQQPRDENGQFTYNSVNAIPLKYGPSRGTTIPPFLRGITLTYCEKSTKSMVLNGKVFHAPSFKSPQELIDAFKEYKDEKDKDGNVIGFGDKMNARLKGKSGARSSAEKAALASGGTSMIGDEVHKTSTGPARIGDINNFMMKFSNYRKKMNAGRPSSTSSQSSRTSTSSSVSSSTNSPRPSSNRLHNVSSLFNRTGGGTNKSAISNAASKLKNLVGAKAQQKASPTRAAQGKALTKDEIDDLFN